MTLGDLLDDFRRHGLLRRRPPIPEDARSFSGVAYDSRSVRPGDLFVCKGLSFRESYLRDAVGRGAVAAVSETAYPAAGVPVLLVHDARRALAVASAAFHGHPDRRLTIAGITGTKGKTTTAYLLKSILDAAFPEPAGILSTVERFTGGESVPAHLTTPESLDLMRAFRDALGHGLRRLVMEVSSQAYRQERVYGVRFGVGVFLNLSEDHIGPLEHPDFEDYFACKRRLMQNCGTAVLYRGTDRFPDLLRTARGHADAVLTFGEDDSADFWAEEIRKETPGFSFLLCGGGRRLPCRIPLEGRFNLLNALGAAAAARALGAGDGSIAAGLAAVRVAGRMNLFEKDGRLVFVDYAHNLLSFGALYRSLREDYPGRPIKVVYGCPGHKNLKRRADLGRLAGEYASRVYLTSEDPGFEDPVVIAGETARHIAERGVPFRIIRDRTEAVTTALGELRPGEILILAGKGEETYQKTEGRYDPYPSDLALARNWAEGDVHADTGSAE